MRSSRLRLSRALSCALSWAISWAMLLSSDRLPEEARGSHHHCQSLGGPGDAGVEPALPALGKHRGFVEQHHVVPLRALRLVHGEDIAVVEFLIMLAHRPFDIFDSAGEAFRAHRNL